MKRGGWTLVRFLSLSVALIVLACDQSTLDPPQPSDPPATASSRVPSQTPTQGQPSKVLPTSAAGVASPTATLAPSPTSGRVPFDLIAFHERVEDQPELEAFRALLASFPGIRAAESSPVRIVEYSPNDRSDLEELVLLRPDSERLMVSLTAVRQDGTTITNTSGDARVYWFVDGRLNAVGPEPEPFPLTPGKHQGAVAYVVDEAGYIAQIALPAVVRLPPFDIGSMPRYGLTAHLNITHNLYRSRGEVETALDLIAEAGFEIVRLDFTWSAFEPLEKGVYDAEMLDEFDWLVRETYSRGLQLLPIVQHVPKWASAVDSENFADWSLAPVADPWDFGDAVGMMVARWPQIRFWQLGNEPNIDIFYTGMDAGRFALQFRAGALSAYYANPYVVIVGPGLAAVESVPGASVGYEEFMERLYAHGFSTWSDVLAFHPYSHPAAGYAVPLDYLDRLYEIASAYGDAGKPVWITEFGAPTAPALWWEGASPISEELQAKWLVRNLEAMLSRGDVSTTFVYNFRDAGSERGDAEHHFGMVRDRLSPTGYEPKLAWEAVSELVLTGVSPYPLSYGLRLEISSGSDWLRFDFGEPESVDAFRVVEVDAAARLEGDGEKIVLLQDLQDAKSGASVSATIDLALVAGVGSLELLMARGWTNSASLRIYSLSGDEPVLLDEIVWESSVWEAHIVIELP